MTPVPPDPRYPGPRPGPERPGLGWLAGLDLAGTTVEALLHTTDKTLLAAGHRGGRPVVVKALTSTDPFWREKFAHEISVYRAMARTPAPVDTPALVHTDGHSLLVLDRLPGRVLDLDRYPTRALTDDELTAAIATVTRFGTWRPPPGALRAVFDYPDRLRRYGPLLGPGPTAVLTRLLAELGEPAAPAHGDPLPGNLILSPTPGQATAASPGAPAGAVTGALVDFEFTGLFLPGLDLAVLHTLLAATPGAPARIRASATAAGVDERALLVNRAVVLARELRIHRELPDGALRRERLALIEPQFHDLTRELQEHR